MPEQNKLEITTLSVQIRVLTIDQKRFTKSVFDQLPSMDPVHLVSSEPLTFGLIAPIIGHVRFEPTRGNDYTTIIGLFVYEDQLFKAMCGGEKEEQNYLEYYVSKSPQLFISI